MEKSITQLIEEYKNGKSGEGPILWHKKPHKKGSGEFACVRGIKCSCDNPVDCPDCYTDKTGGYCMGDNCTESVGGFLAVEYKHEKLVESNAPGAYYSISKALDNLK